MVGPEHAQEFVPPTEFGADMIDPSAEKGVAAKLQEDLKNLNLDGTKIG